MYINSDLCIMAQEDERGLYLVTSDNTIVNILNENYNFDADETGIKIWNMYFYIYFKVVFRA